MIDLPRDNTFSFECQTCDNGEIYDSEQFRSHLLIHGVEKISGAFRKMVLHLDTASHAISTYDCVLTGDKPIKFFKTSKIERESAYQLRKLKAQ